MNFSRCASDVRALHRLFVALACMVAIAAGMPPKDARADFPIATGSAAIGFAFDGTNYLVGIEDHSTPTPSIGAQLINASGAKVGSVISTGRRGISAYTAFDGANYLLIWEDDPVGPDEGRFRIYGQFISPAGTLVGSPFAISSAGVWYDGVKTMAFGGGKYLVTYTQLIDPDLGDDSTNRYIAGRIVDPDGTMGSELTISTGNGDASDVAFDGNNFFVIWREDQLDREVRGRFVSPAGALGTEIRVNNSAYPSDNPMSVTFDGTNYMVIWNDQIDGLSWQVFGQRVTKNGTLYGGVIQITNEYGPKMGTTVAFDGVNYLATWVDMPNLTNWNLYGQYINANGDLLGSKVYINTEATNQLGGAGFANGKYLALINKGVVMGEDGISAVTGVDGLFITPVSLPAAPTISSLSTTSGVPGSAVTITGANFVSGATTVTFNGILSTSVTVTDSNHLTAYVPEGATSGTIRITTSGGYATSGSFTVIPATSTLTVNLTGTGSGSVNATSGVTLACSSPSTSCSASAPSGTSVTLSQTASLGSTFGGWSGACTSTPCTFTLNGDRTVTATFTLQQNLRIGSSYYGTLKSAFVAVASGNIILARNLLLPDPANDATYDRAGVTATLRGGYTDAAFSTRSATDFTSVTAPLVIEDGTLIIDQLSIM
jgi:hypothetical protein